MKAKILCAWCKKILGYYNHPQGHTTHTICDDCIDSHFQSLQESDQPPSSTDDETDTSLGP